MAVLLAAASLFGCVIDADRGLVGSYYDEPSVVIPHGEEIADGAAGLGGNGAGFGLGPGTSINVDDRGQPDPPELVLSMLVRDFKAYSSSDLTTNEDFNNARAFTRTTCSDPTCRGPYDDRNIVTLLLGADGKPVYKDDGSSTATHSKATFDQWFYDVPATNIPVVVPITLIRNQDGVYQYDSTKSGVPYSASSPRRLFLPIDGKGFGNQGKPHNWSFTFEIHTKFRYLGGEFFTFAGDDDLFVYIDKKLAINLGGLHNPERAEVRLDDLGLTIGEEYCLDLFGAERQEVGSNVFVSTTLGLQSLLPR